MLALDDGSHHQVAPFGPVHNHGNSVVSNLHSDVIKVVGGVPSKHVDGKSCTTDCSSKRALAQSCIHTGICYWAASVVKHHHCTYIRVHQATSHSLVGFFAWEHRGNTDVLGGEFTGVEQ